MKRWILLAIPLLLAIVLDLDLASYALVTVLALAILSRTLARNWSASVQGQRRCSRSEAEVGQTLAVEMEVRNGGRLPILWVLLEDLLPHRALMFDTPQLEVTGSRAALLTLAAGARKLLGYRIRCNRRGYFQIGPLIAETGDLFGLHRRFRVVAGPHYLLVRPKVVPLQGFDIASRRPVGEVKLSYRLYEDPTRIAGVREYQHGDPMNRIHWKATARTGQLHSKIYDPSTIAGATILVDFHVDNHDPRHEPVRSELAVTAAASIANAVHLMGQQVGLVSNGRDAADRIRQEGWKLELSNRRVLRQSAGMRERSDRLRPVVVATRRSDAQLDLILDSLARLELTDGLHLRELLEEAESHMPRDATVIAILPRVTVETAIVLGSLRTRGFAVAVIVNTHEPVDFAEYSGPLIAQGIRTYHLQSEASVPQICSQTSQV